MKPGSLVELVKTRTDNCDIERENRAFKILKRLGYVFPVKGAIYTVRDIQDGDTVYLSEIVNPKVRTTNKGFCECGFDIELFRELQPPMDLSELLEETQLITA